jgi:site-specific DNA-methyltransferase (adenine-specific)
VILTYDESDFDEVCGGFPNTNSGTPCIRNSDGFNKSCYDKGWIGVKSGMPNGSYGDEGSAARYFYCAKASKLDRDEGLEEFELRLGGCMNGTMQQSFPTGSGNIRNNMRHNNHPTVKPTSLMTYLVRLVSPKGSTILDPFNGSGSTGKAVIFENRSRNADYKYIGIELSDEYLAISKARIEYAMTADMTIEEDGAVKLSKPDKTKPRTFNLFDTQ